ncbi:MAG: LPS export ABC transporter periplasmic protein LptC [Flavobacteriales bacterium]|nr:LPS export ABC transporter periplasmic protein LptC [Flavobacteriaceae bacterium]PHX92698.1 MAG: LPS export ABC transporter periplasmic protein LptC [Flavobacteriales bacterium]
MTKVSLLAIFAIALFACSDSQKPKQVKKSPANVFGQEYAEKVTIEYTDSGKLRARVFSPIVKAVKQTKSPYMLMDKGLKIDFYDKNGVLESYMTSEYGISYATEKKIIVRRNVEILNLKGETLNTEELIWDQKTGIIRTDKFVKITGENQITTGTGMISNQSFSDWEIINYSGTINLTHDSKPHSRPLIAGRGRY